MKLSLIALTISLLSFSAYAGSVVVTCTGSEVQDNGTKGFVFTFGTDEAKKSVASYINGDDSLTVIPNCSGLGDEQSIQVHCTTKTQLGYAIMNFSATPEKQLDADVVYMDSDGKISFIDGVLTKPLTCQFK